MAFEWFSISHERPESHELSGMAVGPSSWFFIALSLFIPMEELLENVSLIIRVRNYSFKTYEL